MSDRVREAMHCSVSISNTAAPLTLSACIGHDGLVWAVLTDATGVVIAKTRPIGKKATVGGRP